MKIGTHLTERTTRHAGPVTALIIAITLLVAVIAVLPSIWTPAAKVLSPIRVDTDPENMLRADEPVRVRNHALKKEFALHDMIVVGVVNTEHPEGVWNPETLAKIHEVTQYALTLHGEAIGAEEGHGVIARDVIAPSTVDRIEPGAEGEIGFSWLMREPPKTEAEALEIKAAAQRLPFLEDTLVSGDGEALALYLPITEKDLSYTISQKLQEKAASLGGPEEFHVTGLPVAEDTFGVEMFVQMAISAPAAMLVIFLLMLFFFRKLVVIVSPLIIALVSVILTMGLLVIAGFPIHIMSSMIPIFIMPIAVLDSVHIISEFFELYQQTRDRKKTIVEVIRMLFAPMLYTSLTSAAGFASLALTPIPPVQVFGIFVAAGIMIAWLLTITFVPAFVMFIPAAKLENFGVVHVEGESPGVLGRLMHALGSATYRRAKPIVAVAVVVLIVAGIGISKIRVNDNPVKWFHASHPIRVADRVLNEHFAGTYMGYLAFMAEDDGEDAAAFRAAMKDETSGVDDAIATEFERLAADSAEAEDPYGALATRIREKLGTEAEVLPGLPGEGLPEMPEGLGGDLPELPGGLGGDTAPTPGSGLDSAARSAWETLLGRVEARGQKLRQIFKRPETLEWMTRLQADLLAVRDADGNALVGKSNSLADLVETIHRDLRQGDPAQFRIPDSFNAVGQCISQFENSHRPYDLAHFTTTGGPEAYRRANLWIQLKSGDNEDMSSVVAAVDRFLEKDPPPAGVDAEPLWFGLTYINVVWQEKMVWGMLEAFTGSFLVVFLLMTVLFRSPLWGLLSMIPLTVTIAAIYGAVGLVGKDYDMPVAVLSSLTLGLAVDFAIHFLARARTMHAEHGSWEATTPHMFSEPARAISRNIVVIAAGFLPLLLAPLVPYQTVGVLLATILLVSGVTTLVILPALVRLLERRLFAAPKSVVPGSCQCALCVTVALTVVALILVNLSNMVPLGWSALTIVAIVTVPASVLVCQFMSRRAACRTTENGSES